MSKLLVSCGFKRARRWSPKSSLLQLAMDQASAHPEAVDWSNIGNRICSGHTYATLFPINSQNFRNSSAEFRNSYAEFKNSSDHIYVLGTIAGPFWLAAGLPKPRPRNRPETNTFACVGFLSLDRGCELYLPPKFAGWERRPMVFSCKIRCKLHVGPYISNTFPLWNSQGKALSMIRARPSTRLLCLLCYFQKGTDSVHRLFRLFPCFLHTQKSKVFVIWVRWFNTCKPCHANRFKSTEGCAAFRFPPKKLKTKDLKSH